VNLASNAEIVAITRALLALSTAVRETQHALFSLTQPENEEIRKILEMANDANGQCLEQLQILIELIEKNRE
jgi:hypothetical protein